MSSTLARRAWLRWQAAAGPWQGWSICPALLSPEVSSLARVRHREDPRAPHLAAEIRPWLARAGTACVLDLHPTLGVQVAARLADAAHPVLVLPRWPYADAVLPAETLVATLLAEARSLPPAKRLPNVVFVLDGERSQPIPRRTSDQRADNRHAPASLDLPDLKTLRARAVGRIHLVRNA